MKVCKNDINNYVVKEMYVNNQYNSKGNHELDKLDKP